MGDEKPFKCPKCSNCFATSDHLVVHQRAHAKEKNDLIVKIPSSSSDVATDETPTPTRFLKTAEVEGSILFEDINPFDQDFKLASKRQVSASSTQHVSVSSSSAEGGNDKESGSQEDSMQETSSSEIEADQSLVVSSTIDDPKEQNVDQQLSSKPSQPISSTSATPTTIPIRLPDVSTSSSPVKLATTSITQNTQISIQSLLQKLQQKQSVDGSPVKSSTTVASVPFREQLKSLIKSGQLKIKFTSDPSAPKVQATIVGDIPKTAASVQSVKPLGSTSEGGSGRVIQEPALQPKRELKPVLPKLAPSQTPPSSQSKVQINPMSILGIPSSTIVSSNGWQVQTHANSNLAFAKKKLKQVIKQNGSNGMENGLANGRVSMVASSQAIGKYKGVDELDDAENNSYGNAAKRKGLLNEDNSPEEKRQKFLERNRAAASRCRQKRKMWVNQLEKKSDDLMQTNTQLMNEITALRSEVSQLKSLLLAHKDCPVTIQQKSLLGQMTPGSYVAAVSDGQIIAIHQVPPNGNLEASSAEQVASTALTDMAARATVELVNHSTPGSVTVQSSDGTVSTIGSTLLPS